MSFFTTLFPPTYSDKELRDLIGRLAHGDAEAQRIAREWERKQNIPYCGYVVATHQEEPSAHPSEPARGAGA